MIKKETFVQRYLVNYLRVLPLRFRGYNIGKNVHIGKNVVIRGKNVTIGNDVYILDNVHISGGNISIQDNVCIFENVLIYVRDTLEIGQRSKISRNCIWKANKIEIGRDLWCNENVEIGGGGWNNKNANLTIGSFQHIGRDVQINVCEPIIIEGCSGIGIGCKLFTHSAGQGQSVLDGYSFTQKSIHICKHVSLFTNVVVAPGSFIEEGVTVAAQSFVQGTLNNNNFYAGCPAKSKKVIPTLSIDEKFQCIVDMFGLKLVDNNIARGECDYVPIYLIKNRDLVEKLPRKGIVISLMDYGKSRYNNCIINLETMTISGQATRATEHCRDIFRRHGIILFPADEYRFFKLDPFLLKEKYIEI